MITLIIPEFSHFDNFLLFIIPMSQMPISSNINIIISIVSQRLNMNVVLVAFRLL